MTSPFFPHELLSEAALLQLTISPLENQTSVEIRNRLRTLFSVEGAQVFSRMTLKKYLRIKDPLGWAKISELTHLHACYIFTDERDCSTIFLINNGSMISTLIGELGNYAIYITDTNLTYVACLNQYDELWVTGTAQEWALTVYPNSILYGV